MEHLGISTRMMEKLTALPIPTSHPPDDSKIDLSQAENWLIRNELLAIGKKALANSLNEKSLSYPKGFGGEPELKNALASFFNQYFNPTFPVVAEQISVQSGAGNSLDALMFTICDDGDSVLTPEPAWSNYASYLAVHPNVGIIVAPTPEFRNSLSMDCVSRLEAAYDAAPNKERIRALLVCNPHNPADGCYSPAVLRKLMSFCHKRGIHYVSDEVLASCTQPSTTFTSVLSLLDKPADGETEIIKRSHVHVLWSASKDLGSPGARLGCVISQSNKAAIAGVTISSYWQMSILSSIYFTGILTSSELPSLMRLNAERLTKSYQILVQALERWDVEYIPSSAGLLLFVKVLKNATNWEEEADMVERIKKGGVLVAPGKRYNVDGEVGWIRLLFAVPEGIMREAIKRIGKVLDKTIEY